MTTPKEIVASSEKTPKYQELAELFRAWIKAGKLRPGDRLPTFVQMRRDYGATPATVERVISALEREGLVQRRPQSGIYVSEPGQKVRHNTIGFLASPEKEELLPFYLHLWEGVRSECQARGLEMLFVDRHPSAGWERVDGLIGHGEESIPNAGDGSQVPYVGLMATDDESFWVTVDDEGGIALAMKHLMDLGHHSIGYLMNPDASPIKKRLNAYHGALAEAGITPHPLWLRNLTDWGAMENSGRYSMQSWLEEGFLDAGLTALLVQNDRAAMGAMAALRTAGIRVPEDLSVVGFDSTDECELCYPRLTSVRSPLREIGSQAVAVLMGQIDHKKNTPRVTALPAALDIRESTGPPGKRIKAKPARGAAVSASKPQRRSSSI